MSITSKTEFEQWEAASRDTIDVKRVYIDMCGDIVAGVFLSQLLYYFLPVKNDDGTYRRHSSLTLKDGEYWLPMNIDGWWSACRLRRKQYQSVMQSLGIEQNRTGAYTQKSGSISVVVQRNTFYNDRKTPLIRPNWEVFLELLNRFTENYEVGKSDQQQGRDAGQTDHKPKTAQSVATPPETVESPAPLQTIVPKRDNRSAPKRDNRSAPKRDNRSAPFGANSIRTKEQQQEVIKNTTQQEAPQSAADVAASLLKNVVVVSPPQRDLPPQEETIATTPKRTSAAPDERDDEADSAADFARGVLVEILSEGHDPRDARALIARFGPENCLNALDSGQIGAMLEQVRAEAHSAPQTAPNARETASQNGAAPGSPPLVEETPEIQLSGADSRRLALRQLEAIGFGDSTKARQNFLERHGHARIMAKAREIADYMQHTPVENPAGLMRSMLSGDGFTLSRPRGKLASAGDPLSSGGAGVAVREANGRAQRRRAEAEQQDATHANAKRLDSMLDHNIAPATRERIEAQARERLGEIAQSEGALRATMRALLSEMLGEGTAPDQTQTGGTETPIEREARERSAQTTP